MLARCYFSFPLKKRCQAAVPPENSIRWRTGEQRNSALGRGEGRLAAIGRQEKLADSRVSTLRLVGQSLHAQRALACSSISP